MKRLANISIDLDGRDFVFRVRLGDTLHRALLRAFDAGPVDDTLLYEDPEQPDLLEAHDEPEQNRKQPDLVQTRNTHGKTAMPSKPPIVDDGNRDAEIKQLYLVDGLSTRLVAVALGSDWTQPRVMRRLKALNVPIRSISEASALRWVRSGPQARAKAFNAKPKPLAIPEDAPRKPVKIAPPQEKLSGRDTINRMAQAAIKARVPLNLTPDQQQELIKKHFEKGGAVTECPPAHAYGSEQAKSGVGNGYGKANKGARGA